MTEADDDFLFAELLCSQPSDETWANLLANALGSAPEEADPALIPDEIEDEAGESEPVGLDEGEELDDSPVDERPTEDRDEDDPDEDEDDHVPPLGEPDVTDPAPGHESEWTDPEVDTTTGLDADWPGVDDHGAPW